MLGCSEPMLEWRLSRPPTRIVGQQLEIVATHYYSPLQLSGPIGNLFDPDYQHRYGKKPGITASANTRRKLSPDCVIRPIAIRGPATAPIV